MSARKRLANQDQTDDHSSKLWTSRLLYVNWRWIRLSSALVTSGFSTSVDPVLPEHMSNWSLKNRVVWWCCVAFSTRASYYICLSRSRACCACSRWRIRVVFQFSLLLFSIILFFLPSSGRRLDVVEILLTRPLNLNSINHLKILVVRNLW